MNKRSILTGLVVIVWCGGCASQSNGNARNSEGTKQTSAAKADGKGAAPANPSRDWNEATDYAAIRYSYAAKPGYNAYAAQLQEKFAIDDAMKDWRESREPDTLDKLWKLVDLQPLSIEAHRRLADGIAVILPSRKDLDLIAKFKELEHHHRVIYNGLVQSILKSGDGKSAKTAYKVISIPEENWAIFELGLTKTSQAVGVQKGRAYDYIEVRSKDGKDAGTLYFDINLFYKSR